jgi:hypothetical protein
MHNTGGLKGPMQGPYCKSGVVRGRERTQIRAEVAK